MLNECDAMQEEDRTGVLELVTLLFFLLLFVEVIGASVFYRQPVRDDAHCI